MKAIRVHDFGGPEVLKLEEVDDPKPGPGQIVVRVKAAGVNPYDTYMRAGAYGARNPTLPFTPGSDAAGIVEAVGPDVTDIAVGDRVFTTGTITGAYAELAFVDTYWPDFDRRHLWAAVDSFVRRDRRFGGAIPNPG